MAEWTFWSQRWQRCASSAAQNQRARCDPHTSQARDARPAMAIAVATFLWLLVGAAFAPAAATVAAAISPLSFGKISAFLRLWLSSDVRVALLVRSWIVRSGVPVALEVNSLAACKLARCKEVAYKKCYSPKSPVRCRHRSPLKNFISASIASIDCSHFFLLETAKILVLESEPPRDHLGSGGHTALLPHTTTHARNQTTVEERRKTKSAATTLPPLLPHSPS